MTHICHIGEVFYNITNHLSLRYSPRSIIDEKLQERKYVGTLTTTAGISNLGRLQATLEKKASMNMPNYG